MSIALNVVWYRWLIAASIVVLVFGLGFVFLPDLLLAFFNLVLFSSSRGSVLYAHNARGYIFFAHAVLGAVMIGWSISLLYIVTGPFRRGERGAWSALTVSLLAWFVPDSAASLAAGYAGNALLNVGFIALFAVPLAASYKPLQQCDMNTHAGRAALAPACDTLLRVLPMPMQGHGARARHYSIRGSRAAAIPLTSARMSGRVV